MKDSVATWARIPWVKGNEEVGSRVTDPTLGWKPACRFSQDAAQDRPDEGRFSVLRRLLFWSRSSTTGADTAAELLIIFGDTPDRIHSEAAFAKLCGACPIPASSGVTTGRHRLYRGGHRQANAALHRAVIVRMQFHTPTLNYVERRTAEGRPKREIIRCLKRFLAREIFQRVMADYRARQAADVAA